MRQVSAALCVVAVGLTAGCGHTHAASKTRLTVVALSEWAGRAVFHLNCEPAGGDVPDPTAACAAVAAQPQLITEPRPSECWASDWNVTISGRLDGRPIRRSFSTCWTPQMATIKRLGLRAALQSHLVPRRHEAIFAGTTQQFPPGQLRATDLVTCDILGHSLSTPVPDSEGPDAKVSTGFGGAGVTSVELSVTHNVDGSVTASCHVGSS